MYSMYIYINIGNNITVMASWSSCWRHRSTEKSTAKSHEDGEESGASLQWGKTKRARNI